MNRPYGVRWRGQIKGFPVNWGGMSTSRHRHTVGAISSRLQFSAAAAAGKQLPAQNMGTVISSGEAGSKWSKPWPP